MAEKKPLKKWAGGIGEMEPGDKVHGDFIDPWACLPIGVPVPVFTHITGVSAPPTDRSYRYIKLTASDSYNSGVLTSESVSGSAPLVLASAVVSLSGSPINGRTVQLINTERRALRAGSSGTLQDDAFQGHWHDVFRSSDTGRPRFQSLSGGNSVNGISNNTSGTVDINSYQPAQVPVDLSNGEFQLPPEQVHAVGVRALDAMKQATHKPTGRGVPRKELFFADGGLVEDPQKKRLTGPGIQAMSTQAVQTARQSAVSPATQQQAGRGTPGWQTLRDGLAGGAKALVGAAAMPQAAVADAVRNTATLATGGDPDTLDGGSAKYRDQAVGLAKEGWNQAGGATQVLRDAGREALGAQPLATAQPSAASPAPPAAPTAPAGSPAPSAGGAAPAGRGAPGGQGTGIGGDRQGGEIAMRKGENDIYEFTNEAATPGAVSAGRGVPAPGSQPAASPQPRMGVSGYKTAAPQSSIGGGHGLVGNARILAQGSNLLTPDQELARAGSAANVGNGVGTFSQAEAGSAQLALDRFERAGQEREKMIAASRRGQIGEGGGRLTVVRDSSRAPSLAELQNARLEGRLAQTDALRSQTRQEESAAGLRNAAEAQRMGTEQLNQQRLGQQIEEGEVAAVDRQRLESLRAAIADPNISEEDRAAALGAYEALVPQGKGRYIEVRGGTDAQGNKAPSMVFDTRTGQYVAAPGAPALPPGVDQETALKDARAAIANGVSRDAVNQRLLGWGLDPV